MKTTMNDCSPGGGKFPGIFRLSGDGPGLIRRFLLLLIWSLGTSVMLSAQSQAPCPVVCLSTIEATPLPITLDGNCQAKLYASSFMFTGSCPSNKFISVVSQTGQLLGEGMDSVTLSLSNRVGQLLTVFTTDLSSGGKCTGYARVWDVTPPKIVCRDTLLPCNADTSVTALGRPIVLENCDTSFTLRYSDRVDFRNCGGDTSAVIFRTWIARDRSGNSDTCVQRIALRRAVLADVVFPKDTIVDCARALSTHPDSMGYPRWSNRQFINSGGLCRFNVTYRDVVTQTCGTIGRIIDRFWTVEDMCQGQSRTMMQVIRVVDTVAPVIVCPPAKTVRTQVGECSATVLLDRPLSMTDNCDPDPFFTVSTSYGRVGLGPHFAVPAGTHTLIYTVFDACNNASFCQTTLSVIDDEVPTAICDDEVVVALTQTGFGVAAATVFNEGSNDNCVRTLFYKARRETIGACDSLNGDDSSRPGYQEWFDDAVMFCCADVGPNKIRVNLKVYTVNPGPGPVDPAREQPGGDLFGKFNECTSLVQVINPTPPQMFCPPDVTVDCNVDLTNLSRFGSPVVISGCGYRLDSTVVRNLDNCGRGTIRRIFTVTNREGRSVSCTQTITVVNNQMMRAKDIIWPRDTTLTTCGVSARPEDLPIGYQRPQILRRPDCGVVGIMYEDKVYDAVSEACYKIFRTWTVLDWCLYNPDRSDTLGKFVHTQIIKVEDRVAPVFTCPQDVTVPLTNGCVSGVVTLPPLTAADDCSSKVTITHDSPYATAQGANISGVYPRGTTIVTYRVSDGCGNVATCRVRITVTDQKPPSILCFEGLSTSLTQMPGGIMAMVDARMFVQESVDNCSPASSLRFTIRRAILNPTVPPTTTQLTFDCSDLGEQPVEIWAMDEAGNSAYCSTTIRITDFANLCPPDVGLGVVAGAIFNEKGDKVERVKMTMMADKPMETTTDVQGSFKLEKIPLGIDYTLVPQRNDDLMNGVSTIDLIQLSRHILGVQPFTSPYQWIAADIDRSGTVTTLDAIRLRKLILNIDTSLPNGNTSWRFVDADFKFPANQNPLQAGFPEVKNFNNFRAKEAKANFVAVKVGDINGSALPNSLMQSESRTTGGDLIVQVQDRAFKAGETFTVDFYASALDKVSGYQFTLDFDERLLTLDGLNFGDLPEMGLENFGFGGLDKGQLATSWNKGNAQLSGGELVLFSARFIAKRSSDLITALKLGDRPTRPEAYNSASELMQVLLQIRGEDGKVRTEGGFELFQNFPNPFSETTYIGFSLPRDMEASLRIFDTAGRLVHQHKGRFSKGYNEIPIDRNALGAYHGLLYYQLTAEGFNATRKMMTAAR